MYLPYALLVAAIVAVIVYLAGLALIWAVVIGVVVLVALTLVPGRIPPNA